MEYKIVAPYKLMKQKSEAILLWQERIPVDIVARLTDRQPSTITSWVREWRERRLASIHTGHAGNLNASKLAASQRAEVTDTLSKPPSDAGLPAQFWTVPNLAHWVSDRFDVVYESDTSYHYLLHMAGLTFHKPAPFDRRRASENEIDKRMDEIRAEIAEDLDDTDVVVVAADEVRLEHEAVVRRAWIRSGHTPHLAVDRCRQAISYLGLLDLNTGRVTLEDMEWQNTDTIIDALEHFSGLHANKKITIVWDNAAWHRSKKLRSHLGDGNLLQNIHLINMPPYAPDHNPIEHVWNEAKSSISNLQREKFDDTRHAFETFVRGNAFPYRL